MTDSATSSRDMDFAKTDQEARDRFGIYKSVDPFPNIPPALLNSADVTDYVRTTGMIWPFHPDKQKSASYEIALLGKCVYWDDEGHKRVEHIERGSNFVLKANSIAFVTVEPTFRLPDYIALRFNLKISHIYKGILLGTGPLIDPGYEGLLSIPLHNLTRNDYTFKGGDGIIWMEFTKLSPNRLWHQGGLRRTDRLGNYKGFPAEKNKIEDVEGYIEKAVGRERLVQSSIPEAKHSAEKAASSAQQARGEVESIRSQLRKAGYIGVTIAIITVFLPLYFGFYQIHSLINDSHNYVTASTKEIDSLARRMDARTLTDLEFSIELERLSSELEQLMNKVKDEQIKSELKQLDFRLRELKERASSQSRK
jgi:deoxycytidine triphosphate deaminase